MVDRERSEGGGRQPSGEPAERSAESDEDRQGFSEEADSLWRLTFAPLIWAVHFGSSYAATAIVCARLADPGESLDTLRLALALLTACALAGIAWIAWRSWRRWDFLDDHDYEHEAAIEEDRHEFLGHAGFLLAVISFIGVLYVAMVPLMLRSCT